MRHRPQHLGPRSLARRHQRALAWLLGGVIVIALMTLHGDNHIHRRVEAIQAKGQSGENRGGVDSNHNGLSTRRDPRPLVDRPVHGARPTVPADMDLVVERPGDKLAVLIPLWRSPELVEPLLAHLHSHVQAQGIADYRIHVVEQDAAQNFTPGLLVNVGLAVAAEAQSLRDEDVVVYQQATLLPDAGVPYTLAHAQRFLHLASGQAFFGGRPPYAGYCGGAWAMRVGMFRQLRGMANQYVGFDGLEDDLCRRVEQLTRNLTIPGLDPRLGRFTNRDEAPVASHLAALHRPSNQRLFQSRWQAGNGTREVADAVAGTAGDGLHALPEAWRERLAIRGEGPHHTWWLLGGPPDADGWTEDGGKDAGAASAKLLSRDARSDVGAGDARALLGLVQGPIDVEDLLA